MKIKQPCRSSSFDVNNEYLCVVRTKSFADFFITAQLLANNPSSSPSSSSSSSTPAASELLLNPAQETVESILESSSSHLKPLLLNYFNISAEASTLCSNLLKGLVTLQSNHKLIHKIIDAIDSSSQSHQQLIISELRSRIILDHNNSFSNLDFKHIHDTHSSILQQLRSKRKKFARKTKMMKFFVVKPWRRGSVEMRRRLGFVREVVDVAAKGAYILNRDFDTMGRLVGRMREEMEHSRAVMEWCLERRCVQVLKEMKRNECGVRKQAAELEEHVYLCLATINRARAMVVREICNTFT